MVYCTLYPDEMFKNPKITKFCNNNVLFFYLPKVVIARRCCMQFTHGEKCHSTRQGGGTTTQGSETLGKNVVERSPKFNSTLIVSPVM